MLHRVTEHKERGHTTAEWCYRKGRLLQGKYDRGRELQGKNATEKMTNTKERSCGEI